MENTHRVPLQDLSDFFGSKKFWEHLVLEQKASGKTMKAFCCEHQLSLATFKAYKYGYRGQKKKYDLTDKQKESISKFIPLQIIASNEQVSSSTKNNDIKIVFKNGHSVIVSALDLEAAFFIIRKVAGLSC